MKTKIQVSGNKNLIDLVKSRKSIFIFKKGYIDKEKLNLMFDAARWAPSSRNQQPWRFIYSHAVNESGFNNILSCLDKSNIEWAKNASVLIVSVAEVVSTHNNKPNIYAWHDTGMALAYLILQATEFGLATHPMGGFDRMKLKANLQLPSGFEPLSVLAVGYKPDNYSGYDKTTVDKENRARSRKGLDEFVYHDKWINK